MEALKPQPTFGEDDLQRILLDPEQIAQRIDALAREISSRYQGQELTIVSVLNGALVFTADLIRKLSVPACIDFIRVSSYGDATQSQGKPALLSALKTDLSGKHVLVVDDILDTGKTLQALLQELTLSSPASLRSCVLLDKKERRETDLHADFHGFEIPNEFVVGYGLDFAERYRNLPCVGVLKSEFQVPSFMQ